MTGVYKTVWENNINVNPENLDDNTDRAKDKSYQKIQHEKYVRIGEYTELNNYLGKKQKCDVMLTEKRFYESSFAFATYKGFPFLNMFNKR